MRNEQAVTHNHHSFTRQIHSHLTEIWKKIEKFEYFKERFHTTLRMQLTLTEEMKIIHFQAHLRGLAIETFKNPQRTPTTTLETY